MASKIGGTSSTDAGTIVYKSRFRLLGHRLCLRMKHAFVCSFRFLFCCSFRDKYTKGLDVCVTVHHQYNDVNNQQVTVTFFVYDIFKSTLHVSGDKFAHRQEHF